jgi:hypothetical protein
MKPLLVLSAPRDVVDARISYPERSQLPPYGRAQVDVRLVGAPVDDDARARRLSGDGLRDVTPHLEAACPDARANRRNDRVSFEPLDARTHDACDDPAPARVDRGHVARRLVGDEHRDAIGDAYADGEPTCGRAGHHRVRLAIRCFERVHDARSVDLFGLGDMYDAQGRQEFRVRHVALGQRVNEPGVGQERRLQDCHGDG